jgi:hypothetical protein
MLFDMRRPILLQTRNGSFGWNHLIESGLTRGVNCLKTNAASANNASITGDMLVKVWDELEYRTDVCLVTRGAHIERI